MNKLCFFILFLVILPVSTVAQTSKYQINGRINERYNDSLVTLFTFTGEYIRSVDSTYVKHGRFHFEGSEYLYERSLISVGNYPDTVFFAELFLEQGPIEVELKQKSVIHSSFTTEYKKYTDSCLIIRKSFQADGLPQSTYEAGWKRFFAYRCQFKKKYIHNGIGRYYFLDDAHFMDDPYFFELYALLPDKEKKRSDVKDAYEYRKKKEEQKLLMNKLFLDFTLLNSADEEKRISDYIGKSELLYLEFWASWCGPCLNMNPHIKELYEKYKENGFEVVGISLDEDKKKWLSAIEKKGISWPELYVGNQERIKELRELYHISGIPYGVLIDRSGKVIIAQGFHPQLLEPILKQYFKK